jgi:hypothetical protein
LMDRFRIMTWVSLILRQLRLSTPTYLSWESCVMSDKAKVAAKYLAKAATELPMQGLKIGASYGEHVAARSRMWSFNLPSL